MRKSAFSLVELSIVLVILGLLVGGVLSGQSLIRASELRSISSDFQRYRAATYTFRDKYFALPGDMTNATSFWPTTTNGNGNGILENTAGAASPNEQNQYWMQLALAGLIEGSYNGVSGPTAAECIIGTNCPKLRFPQAAMMPQYFTWCCTGTNGWWGVQSAGSGNWIIAGAATGSGGYPYGSILKPEEMWNIDTKMDDGKPATGAMMYLGCSSYTAACAVDNVGAAPTADCNLFATKAPVYNLSYTAAACAPMMKLQ